MKNLKISVHDPDLYEKVFKSSSKTAKSSEKFKDFFTLLKESSEAKPSNDIIPKLSQRKKYFYSIKERFTPVSQKKRILNRSSLSRLNFSSEARLKTVNGSIRSSNPNILKITGEESNKILNIVSTKVKKEFSHVNYRIAKRMEKMEKNGILPVEINEARASSILSVEQKRM